MNTMKKKEMEANPMKRMNHAKVTTSPQQQMAGLNCPRCHGFIPTSITELLQSMALVCPCCQLRLSIDTQNSQTALQALGKIQAAQKRLEHP